MYTRGIEIRKNILPFKEFHSPSKPYLDISYTQLALIEEFNNSVKDGKIAFESIPCLCGCTVFDLIASVDRYSMLQKTVLCTRCGLIQSCPRMTKTAYSDFYSSDYYRNSYEPDGYLSLYRKKYCQATGQHIFNEIDKIKKINSGISVLEIGAGGGWNLLPFITAGTKVLGIDYSPSLVSLGLEYGINMVQGSIDDTEGIFEVIIINHALEHLLNPIESLKSITGHLRDGGLIYIAVPNIFNFGMGQLQNAHTYYFDPKTFVYYCSVSGLKLISFGPAQNIHMFGIYEVGHSNADLTNHFYEVYRYLRKFTLRRYLENISNYSYIGRIKDLILSR
jgi:SAM-dependent methyltransferase